MAKLKEEALRPIRFTALLIATAALGLITSPAQAEPKIAFNPCADVHYTQARHQTYTRTVYRRDRVTHGARARVARLIQCQHTPDAKINARRFTREQRRLREERHVYLGVSGVLERIAACESGGNPRSIGGGGAFRGKYQFTFSTWASVGGRGDPAAAPESEQDMRAAILLKRSGSSPWPVCG